MPWELIDSDTTSATERMEVPGGWLYRAVWRRPLTRFEWLQASGVAFVPKGNDGLAQIQAQAAMQEASTTVRPAEPVSEPPAQPEQP